MFFRSIIVKKTEFFAGAGAGAGVGAENGIIFRLRLQQKSTAPGGSGSGSATLIIRRVSMKVSATLVLNVIMLQKQQGT